MYPGESQLVASAGCGRSGNPVRVAGETGRQGYVDPGEVLIAIFACRWSSEGGLPAGGAVLEPAVDAGAERARSLVAQPLSRSGRRSKVMRLSSSSRAQAVVPGDEGRFDLIGAALAGGWRRGRARSRKHVEGEFLQRRLREFFEGEGDARSGGPL